MCDRRRHIERTRQRFGASDIEGYRGICQARVTPTLKSLLRYRLLARRLFSYCFAHSMPCPTSPRVSTTSHRSSNPSAPAALT